MRITDIFQIPKAHPYRRALVLAVPAAWDVVISLAGVFQVSAHRHFLFLSD